MAEHGLTRRLGRDLLRQAVLISVAVFISMFAAGLMIEDVLIEQALESEADYYWNRVDGGGSEQLPDTQNLTGFRPGRGAGVPAGLAGLDVGFHRNATPRETIVYVSEHGGERLFLQFEAEQVDTLVLIFGTVPLALAHCCLEALELTVAAWPCTDAIVQSDVQAGAVLIHAGLSAALINVDADMTSLDAADAREQAGRTRQRLQTEGDALLQRLLAVARSAGA